MKLCKKLKQIFHITEKVEYDTGYTLLDELYKRFSGGYYLNAPAYQFERDELYIKKILGLIDPLEFEIKEYEIRKKIRNAYWRRWQSNYGIMFN